MHRHAFPLCAEISDLYWSQRTVSDDPEISAALGHPDSSTTKAMPLERVPWGRLPLADAIEGMECEGRIGTAETFSGTSRGSAVLH